MRSLKRSSVTSRSPSCRDIGSTLSAPFGSPASSSALARNSAESGVFVAGLRTMGLPAAMAGASLCAERLSGKLKGEMAATGPMGKRRRMAMRPLPCGARSSGMTSPPIRRASSLATWNVMAARSTSVSASLMGLPASPASARPISVRRRPSTEDAFARIAPRSYAGRLRIVSAAATAAAVASSTWASLASQVEPTGESSQGLVTGSTSFDLCH